jgi:hypothetical protein
LYIYPNPSSGKFTLSGTSDKGQGTSFEIYNMLGERAFLSPDFKQLTLNEIDLSNSPRGIYIVKLYDGTDIHTKKIVIQN